MLAVRQLAPVLACLIPVILVLSACSSALQWTPETHIVRSGDTVYSIAFQYGIDQRDLIAWNRLNTDGLIFPGQRLRLTAPGGSSPQRTSAPSSSTVGRREPVRPPGAGSAAGAPLKWRWPTDGRVIAGFGSTPKTQSGIHIGGKLRQPIRAAAAGEVVYAGSGLPGYGQLLIIRHTPAYLSAYGHNRKLLVGEGDRVQAGQQIAQMGEGPGRRPLLHFEIRRSGRPVNPLGYLPNR